MKKIDNSCCLYCSCKTAKTDCANCKTGSQSRACAKAFLKLNKTNKEDGMSDIPKIATDTLFSLEKFNELSPRMKLIKKHDIKTNHAKYMEEPWLAIPMNLARQVAKEYDKDYANMKDPVEICASVGRLLDDKGMTFYGKTERDVVDSAIQYAERRN